jgi:hypothetical protein
MVHESSLTRKISDYDWVIPFSNLGKMLEVMKHKIRDPSQAQQSNSPNALAILNLGICAHTHSVIICGGSYALRPHSSREH